MAANFADDITLLQELKKNNTEAYDYLYTSSRKYLYLLAFSILGNENSAKDLLQDFFTDLWEFRLYDNIKTSLHSYLYFAIRNRAIKLKKKDQSYNTLIHELAAMEEAHTPRYFENAELHTQIEQAIDKLPPMASKTFKMHYLDNLSHSDIAWSLGVSKRTVANHIHRALTALRQELKKNF